MTKVWLSACVALALTEYVDELHLPGYVQGAKITRKVVHG